MLVSVAPDNTHMTSKFVELFTAWWQHGDLVFDFGSSCFYLKREQESWETAEKKPLIHCWHEHPANQDSCNLSLHDGSCQGYRSIVGVQGGSREDAQERYRAHISLFHTLHQDTVCLRGLVCSIRARLLLCVRVCGVLRVTHVCMCKLIPKGACH